MPLHISARWSCCKVGGSVGRPRQESHASCGKGGQKFHRSSLHLFLSNVRESVEAARGTVLESGRAKRPMKASSVSSGKSFESDVAASLAGLLLVVRGHSDISSVQPWVVRQL